jgi:hypothetical protein
VCVCVCVCEVVWCAYLSLYTCISFSHTHAHSILRFVRGYSKEKHWQEKTLEMVKEFLKFREEKKVDELAEISPDDEGYKEFHKVTV